MLRLVFAVLIVSVAFAARQAPVQAQATEPQAVPAETKPAEAVKDAMPPQSAPAEVVPKQDMPPQDPRFTFHPLKDSLLRLDSRTGQVAQCDKGSTGWSCSAVADERAALENEIARLQGENAALKKSLLARGQELPAAGRAEPPGAKAPESPPNANAGPKTPTEAELDRVMTFMEKVWRRLVEMVVTLQRDIQRKI